MRRVKQKVQKLTETSEASLCDEGDSLVELGTMMKSLEPITKQVEALKGNMSQCVEDVDNLSMVDLLRVVSEIGESISIYVHPSQLSGIATKWKYLRVKAHLVKSMSHCIFLQNVQ